jgi:hypothetical protein
MPIIYLINKVLFTLFEAYSRFLTSFSFSFTSYFSFFSKCLGSIYIPTSNEVSFLFVGGGSKLLRKQINNNNLQNPMRLNLKRMLPICLSWKICEFNGATSSLKTGNLVQDRYFESDQFFSIYKISPNISRKFISKLLKA